MIATILMGLIIGLSSGYFMKVSFGGSTLIGFIVCVVVGIIGSLIGGCFGSALKIKNIILQFILDIVGACVLIAILKFVF